MAEPVVAVFVPTDAEVATRLWRQDLPREHGFEPLTVHGEVPAELRGTLLRNGPGLFGLDGTVRYAHPFEGDGAVTAIRFGDGDRGAARVVGAARITLSAGLVDERAAGRPLYNFSAPWWRGVLNLVRGRQKNTANTSVMTWQGRVLALMEAGRPTELAVDADDLRTIGETDLGGVVGPTFSAHPHPCPARRATYNFGVEYGRHHRLRLYELPDAGAARVVATVPLRHPVMVHDFAVTATHAIWFLHPVELDVARVATGRARGLGQAFRWRPDHASELVVVPLDRPADVVRFEIPRFWVWHFASAFTRRDELVVDYVHYPDASSLWQIASLGDRDAPPFAPGRLHRAVIDPARRAFRTEPVADVACEFPRVHPDREAGDYRTIWLTLDGDRALGAIDVATGEVARWPLGPAQRASEPIPVPKRGAAGDRDVWLLSLVYDGISDRSAVMIFDGARFPAPAVAVAWLDHRVPVTFHGTWIPAPSPR